MDVEIPVLAGYLNVPTQTGFSLNRISKKKPCSRYCLLFKASRHGIARLEMCENKDDKNPKIFTLENCVKITQDPPPDKLIHIVKHNGTLTVNTNSDEELKDWITALQTVAFCDTAAGGHAVHGGAIEEDNDLYCSSLYDGLFMITLIPSEASIRCSIEPKTYMLQMTPTELQLKSEDLNVTIAMWPYRFIRKYGYHDGKFTFEAGRNTIECGENQFSDAAGMEPGSRSPLPPSPSSIRTLAKFEINSTQSCISLQGFISSNDSLNNFAASNGSGGAAAAGGPGGGVVTSVTLSVPPNSCSSSSSKHIPNKPPRKLGGLVPASGPGSQNHCDKYKNIVKYEPVAITTSSPSDANSKNGGGSGSSMVILKPPSPETTTSRSGSTSSISSTPPDLPLRNESTKPLLERDYECIENITEAWRTRGVGDVRHCERIPPILCDTSDFVRSRSGSTRKDLASQSSGSNTPKIIDIDIGEGVTSPTLAVTSNNSVGVLMSSSDSNYDRLDFLSPNNKTSSGYKTIVNVTLPGNRVRCSPPPPNEYELIASPDTESFRKADDSHLGYGVLRKSTSANNNNSNNNNNIGISSNNNSNATTNKSNNESALDHRSYNGLNYTIVSKPKRV
ncbi:GL14696 [Drosophila persimilis]|uniref:GL14696 n=1 Tax=Drosophila persimilis TaxID=7234 RepID=B4GVP9_DROPE|nr:GL14696 [Drosophila persimilis]